MAQKVERHSAPNSHRKFKLGVKAVCAYFTYNLKGSQNQGHSASQKTRNAHDNSLQANCGLHISCVISGPYIIMIIIIILYLSFSTVGILYVYNVCFICLFVLDSVIAQHLFIPLVNIGHNIQGVYKKSTENCNI